MIVRIEPSRPAITTGAANASCPGARVDMFAPCASALRPERKRLEMKTTGESAGRSGMRFEAMRLNIRRGARNRPVGPVFAQVWLLKSRAL